MKLTDIAKLADTGSGAMALAANAVKMLTRIADAVEKIAAQGAPLDVCSTCESAGTWMCPEHGEGRKERGEWPKVNHHG